MMMNLKMKSKLVEFDMELIPPGEEEGVVLE